MTEDCRHLKDQLNVGVRVATARCRYADTDVATIPGVRDRWEPSCGNQHQHLHAEISLGISGQPKCALYQDHLRRPEIYPSGKR